MDERLVGCEFRRDDSEELNLRPRSFDEYIGQDKVKENLMVFIEAAKQRNEASIMCFYTDRRVWGKRPCLR